jgi:UDP-glucose 4-epimerase
MHILVTGGAGYIGSHTCVELLAAGHDIVVVDNLINSKYEALRRVESLTGKSIDFHQVDLLDKVGLSAAFAARPVDAVVHFAALKAVGESVEKPLEYYWNNVAGTLSLLEVMRDYGCTNLVYSSSCTVYGEPSSIPISEDQPTAAAESPYGWSKLMTEQIMRDLQASQRDWNFALLRYFNPVGAHPSGDIGEDPNGIPNNLMPFITQVAVGKLSKLRVFGNDYPTPDGTGIRDYIHVVDLAAAHVCAVDKLSSKPGVVTYNLGTGRGSSVLEVVAAFEQATGVQIPYEIVGRRAGDVVAAYADPSKAQQELGWSTRFDLADMCRDGWNWQQKNPGGYPE